MLGIQELNEEETLPQNRNRRNGGGRTSVLDKGSNTDATFLLLLKEHTAGEPMDEKVKWTDLTCADISVFLAKKGFKVSRNIVRKLTKKHGYVKRKALKKSLPETTGDRNAQFERISELKKLYQSNKNPVVSIDTKKKELIGNLFREGKIYTTETVEVLDHDFPSLAEGVAVPHAIYDIERNEAYVNIGTSPDTSEFACDSIRHWWNNYGKMVSTLNSRVKWKYKKISNIKQSLKNHDT